MDSGAPGFALLSHLVTDRPTEAAADGPIFHICRAEEWDAAEREGSYHGSSQDKDDGFIHFSTAAQLPGTLAKHFAGETGLLLLAVEADDAGRALRWEPSRGGALFPHLYRPLTLADVVWARRLAEVALAGLP